MAVSYSDTRSVCGQSGLLGWYFDGSWVLWDQLIKPTRSVEGIIWGYNMPVWQLTGHGHHKDESWAVVSQATINKHVLSHDKPIRDGRTPSIMHWKILWSTSEWKVKRVGHSRQRLIDHLSTWQQPYEGSYNKYWFITNIIIQVLHSVYKICIYTHNCKNRSTHTQLMVDRQLAGTWCSGRSLIMRLIGMVVVQCFTSSYNLTFISLQ